MKVLLLCNYDPWNAATVSDHINAFPLYSAHDVVVYSGLVKSGGELPANYPLESFDAVILHYSLFLAVDAYVNHRTRERLKAYQGIKAIFLQDEYRFVRASVRRIADTGFDIIFTCVPEQAIEQVYPAADLPGVDRVNVLTGYVPEPLLYYAPVPFEQRPIDVSYRGRRYPAWHGRLGLEKWVIADRFLQDAQHTGLVCDISYREQDRLYGADWVDLLRRSKAVLGVESGASVFDFTGEISEKVESVVALLGDKADYENIRQQYFADIEDQIPLAQISPRIFEAVALRTLCILYEGEYSGVLQPWRHYVPLRKDHSNMSEVLAVMRDPLRMAEITSNAFTEVARNPRWSYRAFIERVDDLLQRRLDARGVTATADPAFTERVRQQYPVALFPNPHALRQVRRRLLHRAKAALVRALPPSVKRLIKRRLGRPT